MTCSVIQTSARPNAPARRKNLLQRIFGTVSIIQQRRALRDMDEYILRDIGITRHEALQEAAKPFWHQP